MGNMFMKKRAKALIKQKYKDSQELLNLSNTKNWYQPLQLENWTRLKILLLQDSKVDIKSITYITIKEWPNIIQLSLHKNKIGPKGIKLLVRTPMPLLEQLWLSQSELGDEGLKLVSKGKWPNMYAMKISGNNNIIDGLIGFTLNSWKKLQYLWVETKECRIIYMTLISNVKQNGFIFLKKEANQNIISKSIEDVLKLTDVPLQPQVQPQPQPQIQVQPQLQPQPPQPQ